MPFRQFFITQALTENVEQINGFCRMAFVISVKIFAVKRQKRMGVGHHDFSFFITMMLKIAEWRSGMATRPAGKITRPRLRGRTTQSAVSCE
ncbi:hypothetical protein HA42_13625 [Pantoea deleyi]|nr:hypothetical protein HA42_13625 [Pantoea deleyi]